MMKIVIDIPDEDYKFIKDLHFYNSGRRNGNTIERNVINGIKNGTPYEERPTGHWESLGFVDMKYAWCRCSNCHKTTKIYKDSSNDFCCIADIRKKAVACLFCGADMRGDKE